MGRLMLLAFAAPMVAAFITPAPAPRGSNSVQRSTSSSTSSLCMMARRPMIAGNWKMNPETVQEAETLAKAVAAAASTSPAQVAIMVPYVYLYAAGQIFKGTNVELGAESVFFEQKGAYTEAVSSCQVKSTGAVHCLAGHSEERVIFKADDAWINKQVKGILAEGLNPLLCIGESKDEYEGKLNTAVCAVQLSKGLKGVTKEEMKRVTIAYEPVWAIGTGLTCDPDTAQSVHSFIREWLAKMYDQMIADNVRILYGGSVTPETVDDLMTRPDIDGCLVGGTYMYVYACMYACMYVIYIYAYILIYTYIYVHILCVCTYSHT